MFAKLYIGIEKSEQWRKAETLYEMVSVHVDFL